MANIAISDLRPTGSELFSDSENYLNDMTHEELTLAYGGGWSWSEVGLIVGGAVGIIASVAATPVAAVGATVVLAAGSVGVGVGGTLGIATDVL